MHTPGAVDEMHIPESQLCSAQDFQHSREALRIEGRPRTLAQNGDAAVWYFDCRTAKLEASILRDDERAAQATEEGITQHGE